MDQLFDLKMKIYREEMDELFSSQRERREKYHLNVNIFKLK